MKWTSKIKSITQVYLTHFTQEGTLVYVWPYKNRDKILLKKLIMETPAEKVKMEVTTKQLTWICECFFSHWNLNNKYYKLNGRNNTINKMIEHLFLWWSFL